MHFIWKKIVIGGEDTTRPRPSNYTGSDPVLTHVQKRTFAFHTDKPPMVILFGKMLPIHISIERVCEKFTFANDIFDGLCTNI